MSDLKVWHDFWAKHLAPNGKQLPSTIRDSLCRAYVIRQMRRGQFDEKLLIECLRELEAAYNVENP